MRPCLKNNLKRGQALVFMLLIFTALLALTGAVIDTGLLSLQKQQMKQACDAAALAGTKYMYSDELTDITREYTAANGFPHDGNTVNVSAIYPVTDANGKTHYNWARVAITKPYNFIFGRLLGLTSVKLTVFSTAQFNSTVPISIALDGVYGRDDPDTSLSICGADYNYSGGDPKSPLKLDDGSPNPYYDPDGYYYTIRVPADYIAKNGTARMVVEIWDADSLSGSTGLTSGKTHDSQQASGQAATAAKFSLYKIDSDTGQDTPIAAPYTSNASNTTQTQNKWYSPPGWLINNVEAGGVYRVQVQGVSGKNVNGFSLRAGPVRETITSSTTNYVWLASNVTNPKAGSNNIPAGASNITKTGNSRNTTRKEYEWSYIVTTASQEPFNSTNGTELFADGPLQIRFAKNGNVSIQLGFVPETAMGVNLHVRRFDTDVGGANNKISYYYKKSYDNGRTVGAEVHNSAWENMPMGTLDKTNNTVGNGEWHEDILPIPEDYEGGVWYCTYYAASNDCSYWEMWYEGYNEGANGFAALVD